MKLQAITLCVHGAHLLSCSLSNRRQFDRWLIVTVPRDTDTIALCRDNELECVTTGLLRADGADIYEGDNLARVTEEAVARLDPDGWVILLSENVILPRTFRAQILAAKLQPACEYRLAGVRHCPDQQVFEGLLGLDQWRAMPTSAQDKEPSFRMFMRSLTPAQIAHLPVTALTVSDACSPCITSARPLIDWIDAHGQGEWRTAMVAGYHSGLDLERFASRFEAVYVQGSDALASLWADEMKRLAPAVRARVHEFSLDEDAHIPAGGIDLLCLPGEVLPETVLPCLPAWRRALHPNAFVCGDLYGMANWPHSTATIARLFGSPQVERTGFWRARLADAPLRRAVSKSAAPPTGSKIIRLTATEASDEDVLLSLYTLRKAWPGTIQLDTPRNDPVLQLQCALLDGDWRARHADVGHEIAIPAGTLAFGPIRADQPIAQAETNGWSPPSLLQRIGLGRNPASLVLYRGDPARWSRKARAARSSAASEMYRALFPAIRTAADSTVTTIVDPSTLPAFRAQWPSWVFDTTPVIIAHVGIDRSELDLAAAGRTVRFVKIDPAAAASPARTLKRIVSHASTKRLILLPAAARPLPGATLFAQQGLMSAPIALHSSAEVQLAVGAAPLPERHEPLAACMDLALVRDICRAKVVKHKGSIGALLNRALQAGQARWATCNLAREGWQLDPSSPPIGAP